MATVDNNLHQGAGKAPQGAGEQGPMKRMESVLPSPIGAGDVGSFTFPALPNADGNSSRNDDEGPHPFGVSYPTGPHNATNN